MSPHHGPEHHLQNPLPIQAFTATRPIPGKGINHIPHAALDLLPQMVIQLDQHLLGLGILAHLEELHPNLPSRRIHAIQSTRRAQDDRFNVVGRLPVRNNDDVQRLDALLAPRLQVLEIRFQDGVQARAGGGAAAGVHGLEYPLHGGGGGDVRVLGAVRGVQEVDVDPVGVVLRADRRDGLQRESGFAPGASCHGARVVD